MEKLFNYCRRNLSLDLRSLALMRIVLGSVLLIDLGYRFFHIKSFYTDVGVLPRAFLTQNAQFLPSFHMLGGSYEFQLALFIATIAATISLTLGYKTTLASIVTWVLFISMRNRNPILDYGLDWCFSIGLLWGMFLPWGRRFSLDDKKQTTKNSNQVFNIATFGFLLHISLFYFINGFTKISYEWSSGSALYYIFQDNYTVTALGKYLLRFPEILVVATYGSLALERVTTFLLFFTSRVRLAILILLIFLHLGIAFTLGIYLFQWATIALLVGLLPSIAWTRLRTVNETKQAKIPLSLFNKIAAGTLIVLVFLNTVYVFYPLNRSILGLARQVNEKLHMQPFFGFYAPSPSMDQISLELSGVFKTGGRKQTFSSLGDHQQVAFLSKAEPYDRRWSRYIEMLTASTLFRNELTTYPFLVNSAVQPFLEFVCRQLNRGKNPPVFVEVRMESHSLDLAAYPSKPREYKRMQLCQK